MRELHWLIVVTLLFAHPQALLADDFDVWINAFIPNQHDRPDYLRPRPGHPSQTMVPGPTVPSSNLPLPLHRYCYNTNNRSWSLDGNASSKIAIGVRFSTDGRNISHVELPPPRLTPSEKYDCDTGELLGTRSADPAGISVSRPRYEGDTIVIDVNAESGNPFEGKIAPTIKFAGKLLIDSNAGTVVFDGYVAEFPSYEAYVAINGSEPMVLFQEKPAPNSTAWSLILNRKVTKTIQWNAFSGTWVSNDRGARWRIDISDTNVVVTERNEHGRTHTFRTQTEGRTRPLKVLRPNDAPLLQFLGFSPRIAGQVLARGPAASIMELDRDGQDVILKWSGLLIIKNDQGELETIRQPGTMPPKIYRLTKGPT